MVVVSKSCPALLSTGLKNNARMVGLITCFCDCEFHVALHLPSAVRASAERDGGGLEVATGVRIIQATMVTISRPCAGVRSGHAQNGGDIASVDPKPHISNPKLQTPGSARKR